MSRILTHREQRALALMPRGMSPQRLCWSVLKSQVCLDLARKAPARQRRQVRTIMSKRTHAHAPH